MKVVKSLGTEDSGGDSGGDGLVVVVAIVRLRRRQWRGDWRGQNPTRGHLQAQKVNPDKYLEEF